MDGQQYWLQQENVGINGGQHFCCPKEGSAHPPHMKIFAVLT